MSITNEGKRLGTCALCRKQDMLEKSHIVPKFIFRRIMKNSPSGFMRNPYDPDVRLQDGSKEYLLCGDCEDRFSKLETKFANKVFHPYKNEKIKDFEYEEWLIRFIVSVNWRTLYLDLLEFLKNGNIDRDTLEEIIKNEEVLREFLLEKRNDIGNNEVHMFFFDDIKEATNDIKNSHPHSFILNSSFDYVYTYSFEKEKGISIIANLSGIFVYTIMNKLSVESEENTLVNLSGGNFKANEQKCSHKVVFDTFYMVQDANKEKQNISQTQVDKISKSLEKNKDKLEKSEIFKHIKKDIDLQES
ncbi:hypothetical protein [Romboutsia timonensis]|uniref:hypothetical protein n=1 Tax=Romboutsia timonensis TaxID=1776391 RepID=UPI0008D8E38C|nr:hypothetical protein [Romboutsia timonensis]